MWLADLLWRQGHLSERTIAEAVLTGDRPPHLDQCELCAERAIEQERWLEDIRQAGLDAADAAFPAERLAAQQGQIVRRLEQLDEPTRVIAFPRQPFPDLRDRRRRVAPAWVGVAAAAGLAVGVVSGHMTARVEPTTATAEATAPPAATPATSPVTTPRAPQPRDVPASAPTAAGTPVRNASLFDIDLEGFTPGPLQLIDESTPKLTASYTTADRQ